MSLLLKISIVLIVGVIGGRGAKHFKLPNVSGFLVAGLFLGPTFFKFINSNDMESFSVVNELALATIAFTLGNEFILKDMIKLGKSIVIITLTEVIGAIGIVFIIMYYLFHQPFAFSIVIAAMSAATAPAATMLVIKQYKAHGPLTRTILPVVALDDVFGIIAFGIAISLAKLSSGQHTFSVAQLFMEPAIEIGGSIVIGLIMGLLYIIVLKKSSARDELQAVSLAAIGIATGIANYLGLSPLLVCIVMGATVVNITKNSKRVFDSLNDFVSPVYILFFTLAGASLELNVLIRVGFVGFAYVLARAAGKMLGAWSGAKIVKADPMVTRYLSFALLPQGGISIGLLVLVRQQIPDFAVEISTIIMFSVLIYEISGPIFAKLAIQKAGEINGLDQKKKEYNKKKNNIAHAALPVSEG
ncbi:cation:proton antiporter [Candidatus Galacturonibacter soehngenii]|uniref:Cation:proton antiporter n=1 Tax=Candidatus Galacturonatibacter soehngenii TaxID=2307010 RepID=A0A7V7QK56_9FIRM|nr:cation:proton antiporter [Candidatus Galacturonibacter soehngenii]KAB1437818.1 cation:proton antiporter [Candidatus Galacturonibacter soehngenii]MBA4687413.1 cation:proton antiporter [Candidatus Galacturonibacter soehngenii]